ncbi:MAG: cupredoxin domain-containing protein [Actinomycetota bacterium]
MKRALVAGLVVTVVALVGCTSGSARPTGDQTRGDNEPPFELSADPVETTEVTAVKSYKFDPEVIQVEAGSEVTWVNEDDFPHNVHFFNETDETYDLPIGESAGVGFDEAGQFYYECSIHPQTMRGKVIVDG